MGRISQRTREKTALAVFGLLLAVLLAAVVVALAASSRSLNVTASNLNDALGDLDGYTVIVYESPSASDDSTNETTLEEVAAAYEEKGASVLVLDLSDLSYYEEGLIILCGDVRIGVFCVDIYSLQREIRAQVEYFMSYDVDYIVAITPHTALLRKVSGVDVVVSTRDDDPGTSGEVDDWTFYVSIPSEGSFGVVLISSTGTVSSKVITSL